MICGAIIINLLIFRVIVMWGTDGTKLFTIDDGWSWLFSAVKHWNAECVGWHVAKTGDRFAALQPLSMAVKQRFGSVAAGSARGLTLRMDNGSQVPPGSFPEPDQVLGHGAELRFRIATTDQRSCGAVQQNSQRANRLWPHLSQHRRVADWGRRVHGKIQPALAGGKTRIQKPKTSSG
jgi:hypothetical protein